MKKPKEINLSFLSLLLFLFITTTGCPPTPPTTTPCDASLEAQPISEEYIVYLCDANGDVPEDADDVINNLASDGDEVTRRCMCNSMVLMKTPPDVDSQERILNAQSKLGSSGDPKGIAKLNYPIEFGPTNTNLPNGQVEYGDTIPDRVLDPTKKSIVVAIVDTGFDRLHPELRPFIWTNPNPNTDGNCIPNDRNGANVNTGFSINFLTDGHGTAVAGKVANLPFLTETYPSDIELQLMNVKYTNVNKGDLFDAVCAMRYAIDQGADVIVASWGLYKTDIDPMLKEVLLLAKKKNVTVVAAAGNHSNDNDACGFFPAKFADFTGYEHVISVGANDKSTGNLASFSNFGASSVLLVADGAQEPSIFPASISPGPQNVDGTSIATPIVASVVSIIKARNPAITPIELRKCLLENTDNDTDFPMIRTGLLNQTASIDACR